METSKSNIQPAGDLPSKHEVKSSTSIQKVRGKKRKRSAKDTETSSDDEPILPENSLEVEKNLHASAIKNNLTEKDVKHIIKKVVTNDHVLALVQLREEAEGSGTEDEGHRPKITRSKAKELMKSSPKSAPWNLELSPIKQLPVKTRPEVTALIAQDLPDESDEEYQPAHDDVSDDDHTIESCSDIDSLPRTPSTPKTQAQSSPVVVKDGPFKIPQDVKTPARRILDLEEKEATIALRTRSKLSLSGTPIEHIESSFVPPDELPLPDVDDLWNQFLNECLDPAPTLRNEDDDEADPEYNVAADPDAHDEDEETLENSLIKISKKELNDLVTELFHIIPESVLDDGVAEKVITNVEDNATSKEVTPNISAQWEGKQEPMSDEETQELNSDANQRRQSAISIGKSEVLSDEEFEFTIEEYPSGHVINNVEQAQRVQNDTQAVIQTPQVSIQVEESTAAATSEDEPSIPPLLVKTFNAPPERERFEIIVQADANNVIILPEQVLIFQQQLRQHIQLCTSNFLQLYVHPVHWRYAPKYKEHLECLNKILKDNPKSAVNVCNLAPAMELIHSWEVTTCRDTPENKEMIQFLQNEADKCRRRLENNGLYLGDFHPMFQQVIANSSVFLYPYLLPPVPYRTERNRRNAYVRSEDELIALGLDQFWQYIEDNEGLYKKPLRAPKNRRWGVTYVIQLVNKHMFPWIPLRILNNHISHVRKSKDPDNPINKFFMKREINPVKHKLLSYNPNIVLHEQPEHELPFIWVRYLSKTCNRAKRFIARRAKIMGQQPQGVDVEMGNLIDTPTKTPLPIEFTQKLMRNRLNHKPITIAPRPLIQIQSLTSEAQSTNSTVTKDNSNTNSVNNGTNFFSIIQTSTGPVLIPLKVIQPVTNTVFSVTSPLTTAEVKDKTNTALRNKSPDRESDITSTIHFSDDDDDIVNDNVPKQSEKIIVKNVGKEIGDHCKCCILIRKICKERQSAITDFFKPKNKTAYASVNKCPCKRKIIPKTTNKFRLFIAEFKNRTWALWCELNYKIEELDGELVNTVDDGVLKDNKSLQLGDNDEQKLCNLKDLVFVLKYQLKLWTRLSVAKSPYLRKRIHTLLSRFVLDVDSPIGLARELEQKLSEEMPDMFKEFLSFLTEEQADRLKRYREYFVETCLQDFCRKLEEEILDKEQRLRILSQVKETLSDNKLSCNICYEILPHLATHPRLAQYFFSLFPHRHKNWSPESGYFANSTLLEKKCPKPLIEKKCPKPLIEKKRPKPSTRGSRTPAYEGDDSSSGEENDKDNRIPSPQTVNRSNDSVRLDGEQKVECGTVKKHAKKIINIIDTPELTISKTEVQDYDSSENSMMIMSDDETLVNDRSNWKREEDKQILEFLKESLPPEERLEKSIEDILTEKNVYENLANSLLHKSLQDVKERTLYLLGILLMSEKN